MLFLLDCPAGFRQAFIRLTQIDTRPFSRWQLSSSLTYVFLIAKTRDADFLSFKGQAALIRSGQDPAQIFVGFKDDKTP